MILSARRADALEAVRQSCENPERHQVVPLDLEDHATHSGIVSYVFESQTRIDCLINNGGMSQRSLALGTCLKVDRRLMEINFLGTVSLTKAILPSMIKAGSGHIVVVSSVAGKFGSPLRSSYSASKHALHGFFDSLRAEIFEAGVRVHMVCPGFVRTRISLNAFSGDGSPHGKMDGAQESGMSLTEFARQMVATLERGRAEIVIGGMRERMGVMLSRYAPSLLRWVIRRVKVD